MNKQELLERDALVISRARAMIKAHKSTSNGALYRDLFGTGFGTARQRCRNLGLDPDSNVTNYYSMLDYLRGEP